MAGWQTDGMSTDILSEIDDTLTSWSGSRDSMRWQPQPTPEQAAEALARMATMLAPSVQALNVQFAAITRSLNETLIPLAKALGYLPAPPQRRARLDARYHQRQKNRRKRRR